MLFNFTLLIIAVWVLLYLIAYACFFKFMGLVTREHDGNYELFEFYWNGITNDYKLNLICRGSERTYNLWNADPDITELHKMIEDMRTDPFRK